MAQGYQFTKQLSQLRSRIIPRMQSTKKMNLHSTYTRMAQSYDLQPIDELSPITLPDNPGDANKEKMNPCNTYTYMLTLLKQLHTLLNNLELSLFFQITTYLIICICYAIMVTATIMIMGNHNHNHNHHSFAF